jgi:hypothetical protein
VNRRLQITHTNSRSRTPVLSWGVGTELVEHWFIRRWRVGRLDVYLTGDDHGWHVKSRRGGWDGGEVVHDFTTSGTLRRCCCGLWRRRRRGRTLGEDAPAATFALDEPTTHPRASTPGREGSRRVS